MPSTISNGHQPKNDCKYTHYFTISPHLIVIFYSKKEKSTISLIWQTISLYSYYLLLTENQEEKRKTANACRLSNYSPHTTWILWNDQESKAVMESYVSIVSFDWLPGCIWLWGIFSSPCSECTSCFCSCSQLWLSCHPLLPHKCKQRVAEFWW